MLVFLFEKKGDKNEEKGFYEEDSSEQERRF